MTKAESRASLFLSPSSSSSFGPFFFVSASAFCITFFSSCASKKLTFRFLERQNKRQSLAQKSCCSFASLESTTFCLCALFFLFLSSLLLFLLPVPSSHLAQYLAQISQHPTLTTYCVQTKNVPLFNIKLA